MASQQPEPSDHPTSAETHVLLARHRAGDPAALGQLITRYYSRVQRMVRIRMGTFLLARETVDDVVQDVFVRVIDGVERFETRNDARWIDWLAKLIQREIANHSRRERAQKRGGGIADQVRLHAESVVDFEIQDDTTGVASRVSRREQAERLDACVSQLAEPQREVILLRDYAGGDWQTVAEEMGRPSAEACQELHRRARIALGRRLQG